MDAERYVTGGGIQVRRITEEQPFADAIQPLVDRLDRHRGVVLASSYEYPGRYTRWDIGFADPPLVITARGRRVTVAALNARGHVMLPWLAEALERLPDVAWRAAGGGFEGEVAAPERRFTEEERSRQPSVFSVLRAVIALFSAAADRHLGLYGAFGYDLAFQFEPVRPRLARAPEQRDLVVYLPDELIVVDHRRELAVRRRYEFARGGVSTAVVPGGGTACEPRPAAAVERDADHAPGEYAAGVRRARAAFARGDLFEVVPGQVFYAPCPAPPSEVFRRLRERNPAPYGFLINLGAGEYLVGGSPETYVRVEGGRVETCPISGTVARGRAVFGVCLGLQGIVEHLGGELAVLAEPVHGKPSRVRVRGGRLFAGLPREFEAGRYHSLFARRDRLPAALHVTAETAGDGVVMAIEHASLALAAVQFHPESILTLGGGVGLALVANVVAWARARDLTTTV